jgi:glutamine synthetase
VQVDPGTLPAAERAAKGIRPLPSSQREALDALAADAVLTGAMGEVLARSYLAVRGSEWDVYSAADEAFEQQGHFQKY